MPVVVVDASVVVKWFVYEGNSDKALEIRDEYISGELKLIAPEIINFEVLMLYTIRGYFQRKKLKR